MITVFFKHKQRWGTTLTLPYVGSITVSIEGTFEHKDEEAVKRLCEHLPALCTTDEDTKDKPVVGELKSRKDYVKMLSNMTMKQLKELATGEEGLPKKEWEKLQKNPLIEYLASKLFEQQGETVSEKQQAPARQREATQVIEDDDSDPDFISEK